MAFQRTCIDVMVKKGSFSEKIFHVRSMKKKHDIDGAVFLKQSVHVGEKRVVQKGKSPEGFFCHISAKIAFHISDAAFLSSTLPCVKKRDMYMYNSGEKRVIFTKG